MYTYNKNNLIFKLLPPFTHSYLSLVRLDKPIGFLLLFYPVSFVLASSDNIMSKNVLVLFLIFFLGSIIMRSAGCIVNDLIDTEIDKKVIRTKNRALASSKISIKNALILLLTLLIIGFLILIQLNFEAIILGIVITPLIALYPLAKRFFILPQFILALTYNWGCFIGWAALGSNIPFSSIFILYLSLIFWTLAYDTIYATQDEKEDKNLNLYSSTLLFGSKKMIFLNLMIITKYFLIIFYGSSLDFGFIFNILVLTISLINLLDLNLIWKNKPENASSYFSRNNYYGISLLFSILIGSHFNV